MNLISSLAFLLEGCDEWQHARDLPYNLRLPDYSERLLRRTPALNVGGRAY